MSVHFLKKTDYNTKITEIEGKIFTITGLATTAALNIVKNKIPNFGNLVKKQIMMQKYQTPNLNILPHLIITNLRMK